MKWFHNLKQRIARRIAQNKMVREAAAEMQKKYATIVLPENMRLPSVPGGLQIFGHEGEKLFDSTDKFLFDHYRIPVLPGFEHMKELRIKVQKEGRVQEILIQIDPDFYKEKAND